MPWSYCFLCSVSSQLFHSPLSPLSRGSFSAIRVVSSACLRLLIFLPAVLIPACALSSPAFYMMYVLSTYKLNKQDDSIQPWHTPFPIWNQSVVTCLVLTVASWPAYRFLRRQVRWSGIPIGQNRHSERQQREENHSCQVITIRVKWKIGASEMVLLFF